MCIQPLTFDGATRNGRTQSNAVKSCRADARGFAQGNASYEAEFDSLYRATTLAQRPIGELLDRDNRLMQCMITDSGNKEEYKAVLYRDGFIKGNRFQEYIADKQQLQDFAQWEKNQQAAQLASYRKEEQQ
jgi:hypothetical protein